VHCLYADIYSLLDEHGIRSAKQLGRARRFTDLDLAVYDRFQEQTDSFADWFNSIDGVRLCIDVPHTPKHLDVLVRKAVLFGTVSVFPVGDFRRSQAVQNFWDRNRPDTKTPLRTGVKIPETFYIFLIGYRRAIEESLVAPIPSRLSLIVKDKDAGIASPPGLLQTAISNSELKRQLAEIRRKEGLLPAGTVDLYAPELRCSSLDALVALRMEEHEAYHRFQRRLRDMLNTADQSLHADHVLLELMRETHDGVMQLQHRLLEAKRRLSARVGTVALGMLSAGLCLVAPTDYVKMLSALVGTGTLMHGMTSFGEYRSSKCQIAQSDFYIPWRLAFS